MKKHIGKLITSFAFFGVIVFVGLLLIAMDYGRAYFQSGAYVDYLHEITAGQGVNVDGIVCKDSEITGGTWNATAIALAKGGLGADVSGYNGLVKISGGSPAQISLPLSVGNGGSGTTTFTDGGVLVGNGSNIFTALTVGTNGQVLIGSTGADPVFASITPGEAIAITPGAGTLQIYCETADATNKGVIEIATPAETSTGSDSTRAVTPYGLKNCTGFNATQIADGTVSNTELQYINSVTSNVQTQINNINAGANGGWINYATPPAYSSEDTRIYTVVWSGLDLSATLDTGMRFRTGQYGTYTYSIATKLWVDSGDTYAVCYAGSGTDSIANATINTFDYALPKTFPKSFPIDPDHWTEELTSTDDLNASGTTADTWYPLTNIFLDIPPGRWMVTYTGMTASYDTSADITGTASITLSTSNSGESDNMWTSEIHTSDKFGSGVRFIAHTGYKMFPIDISAYDRYYLLVYYNGSDTPTSIGLRGSEVKTVIRALSAYY